MNKEYKEYLLSDEWVQLKIDLFALRGKMCEKCFSKKSINVHHLNYDNIFKEEPEDLIILCGRCHLKAHGLLKNPKRKKVKNKNVSKFTKILSLEQKVKLKKNNPKQYKAYCKRIKKIPKHKKLV